MEREGRTRTPVSHTPDTAMSLTEDLDKANRRLKEENEFLAEVSAFFCCEPSEVGKEQRMRFIEKKTDGGEKKGKVSLYCRALEVSQEGFYRCQARKERPWKYQDLADAMCAIPVQ